MSRFEPVNGVFFLRCTDRAGRSCWQRLELPSFVACILLFIIIITNEGMYLACYYYYLSLFYFIRSHIILFTRREMILPNILPMLHMLHMLHSEF